VLLPAIKIIHHANTASYPISTHPTTHPTMFSLVLLFATLLPLIVAADAAKSRTVNPALNAQIKSSATNFDKQALLSKDSDWWYDFDSHPNYNSLTGAVITADAATFPALTNTGISIALLKLAPCGMLPPHLHPRATNLVTAITGNTTSWMIGENGVKTQMVHLTPMRMTIFPQGSLHVMQNNGECSVLMLTMVVLMRDQTVSPRSLSALSTAKTVVHSTSFLRYGASHRTSSRLVSALESTLRASARTFPRPALVLSLAATSARRSAAFHMARSRLMLACDAHGVARLRKSRFVLLAAKHCYSALAFWFQFCMRWNS
jgi:oxalate decarboxylase/phosphoglucose isomerase-like protein (cupin superfamily)